MRRHGLDQDEPVAIRVVDDDVGHLAVDLDLHAERRKGFLVEVGKLVAGVADVEGNAVRREALGEIRDDLLHEHVLTAGGKCDLPPRRQA